MDGKTISHYRVLATLGAGGMGVVHLAEDLVLHRRVALKVLRPEAVGNQARRDRFLQEARSAAALNHPHIATIYEASETDDTLFIAMELIDGRDLRTLLAEPLPLPRVLDLATQVAEGLAHAHAQGVVHRDLKPENIMVTPTGRAKILDFGLAKLTDGGPNATLVLGSQSDMTTVNQLTVQGQVMGTPAYMSPEQARGQNVDFRSDVFSFGCTLYEMCTGKSAFLRASQIDTLSAVLNVEPPMVSHVIPAAPLALEDIIARCLAKEPAKRYANTDDLVADLRGVDLTAKRRRRPRAFARRKWIFGTSAVLALAMALAAGLWLRPRLGGSSQGAGGRARDVMLVADFEGSSPELAVASRELVGAALAQSSLVTPLSRAQVQRGIRMAGLPDSTRVVGVVARELALRATARAYVGGRVDFLDPGYSIVLNVADAKQNTLMFALNGAPKTKAEFIDTMEQLSRELREKLGESRADIRSTGRLREIITPSFEAYQYFVRGVEMHRQRQFKASNALLRQALVLDPEFASAEKLRALNYSNLGFADSARTAYDNAFRRPERLTEAEQLDLKFFDARVVRYDLHDALAISDQLVRLPQISTAFLNNRSTVQFNLGRYEDALATQDSALAISLFGASELLRLNNFKTLMQVGRYDKARAARDSLTGTNQAIASLEYAVCRREWPTVDRLAADLLGSKAAADVRFQARLAVAARAAQRGAIGLAANDLEAAVSEAPDRFWADVARAARVQLGICAGAPLPTTAAIVQDTTLACVIVRGVTAAAVRDTATQAAALQNAQSRSGPDRRRDAGDLLLLNGWAAANSNPESAVSLAQLDSAMTTGTGPWFSGRLPVRWLLATEYERAGRTADAIRAYELVLDSQRLHQDAWMWWPLAQPFAQLHLARLHAKAGQRDKAESRAREVLESLTEPDSQGAQLIAEAKAVLGATPP